MHKGFQLLTRWKAFIVSRYHDGERTDCRAAVRRILQAQSLEQCADRADGEAVARADRVDDMLDMEARG